MKRIVILFFILWFIASCSSQKEQNKELKQTNQNIQKNIIKKWKQKEEINFSPYDIEIIKLAIKWDIKLCSSLKEKENECKKIVIDEKNKANKWDCENKLYFKKECIDNKNYKNLLCDKIVDSYIKKQCILEKKYKEAIENKDLDFCNHLPRIKKKQCIQDISN